MAISGRATRTYLLLSGLELPRSIRLSPFIQLQSTAASVTQELIITLGQFEINVGVLALFLRRVRAQLQIDANDPKELAARAWNTQWDAVLLGALLNAEIGINLQSDVPAHQITETSIVEITNYHFESFVQGNRKMTEQEAQWIEDHFEDARALLEHDGYLTAVHAMGTYTSQSYPRLQLALIWSGIEALFHIDSELAFRLSLYISRFLSPDDIERRKYIFEKVKRLYTQRSTAVHGGNLKGDRSDSVSESSALLLDLIRQCIENRALPEVSTLAP